MITGEIEIESADRYRTDFSRAAVPDRVNAPDTRNVRHELDRYPRAAEEVPAWMRDLIT